MIINTVNNNFPIIRYINCSIFIDKDMHFMFNGLTNSTYIMFVFIIFKINMSEATGITNGRLKIL